MNERWHQVPRDVLEQALEIVTRMQKHEALAAAHREIKSLKNEVEFLRKHIQNMVNQSNKEQ